MVYVCVTNLVLQIFEPKYASFTCGQGLCNLFRFQSIIPDQLFPAIFANPGGFRLIVADQLALVLANLCGFQLIFANQFARMQRMKSPSLSFPLKVLNLFSVSSYILGKGSLVQTISVLHGLTLLTVTVCTGCQHDLVVQEESFICSLSVNAGFVYSTAFKDQKLADVVRRPLSGNKN